MSAKNTHMLYDTNMAVQLSTNAEISFDVHIPSNNGYDYRYGLFSKALYDGMNYPKPSLLFLKKSSSVECNEMLSSGLRYSSYKTYSTPSNEYITMKYVKNGTEISVYVNDNLIYTDTVSWINDYTDYTVSMIKWGGASTMYMKNVKIKPL